LLKGDYGSQKIDLAMIAANKKPRPKPGLSWFVHKDDDSPIIAAAIEKLKTETCTIARVVPINESPGAMVGTQNG